MLPSFLSAMDRLRARLATQVPKKPNLQEGQRIGAQQQVNIVNDESFLKESQSTNDRNNKTKCRLVGQEQENY